MELQNNSINYCELYYNDNELSFSKDIFEGLTSEKKYIPCKYIYDDIGSRLFQHIMNLEEYYLTDCEKEILQTFSSEIAGLFADMPISIVELGAGDGIKTEILLNAMLEKNIDLHYIPVDISEIAVEALVDRLSKSYDDLYTAGLISEYFHGLRHISQIETRQKLVLFLGSNIGNMMPEESMKFLSTLRQSLNKNDYLLIGFDLIKDFSVLNKAYNDSKGITELFNKNILDRINKELGGTFNKDSFLYHSSYEPAQQAVMTYLISKSLQNVLLKDLNTTIHFDAYEAIHTESSYKYTEEQISFFAESSGFHEVRNYTDRRNYFIDALWVAV